MVRLQALDQKPKTPQRPEALRPKCAQLHGKTLPRIHQRKTFLGGRRDAEGLQVSNAL